MSIILPKLPFIRRPAAMDKEQFLGQVVRPLLAQVAAGNVRKNHAMVLAALCGNIHLLPIHVEDRGKTNPLYSFYAVLNQIKMQPVKKNKKPSPAQTVYPAQIELYQLNLPIVGQLNKEHGVSERLIDSFFSYCDLEAIDPAPFVAGNGQVEITHSLMQAIAYWASNKAAWEPCRPPMTLVPKEYKIKKNFKNIDFLANENE